MYYRAFPLMAILIFWISLAGCTQPSGTVQDTPAPALSVIPAAAPETTVPETVATAAPREGVTVIHQVSQQKDIKDSELLFALRVPVEWDVSTYQSGTADEFGVITYRTDLVGDDGFSIETYTVSRSQDQAYRDRFRNRVPAPAESTVTINGIVYDRFESSSNGKTSVAYVSRKGSANERGYASVIVFTADDSHRFEKEDYESVVSSFRYFSADAAGTVPGQEIERTNPPFLSSGSMSSAKGSAASGSAGGSSSGGCSICGK
jgi:hypothetical protein